MTSFKAASFNPFPTNEQELLLKAALFKADEASLAWQQWNKMVDFEGQFDNGSFRLMPLIYKNLLKCEKEQIYIGRLKNIYLQNWYKNQQLFHEGSKIVSDIESRNIRTIILKGAPLSYFAYKDNGVRPMSDIDIMVPYKQASEVIDFLKSSGWIAEFDEYIEYNLKYGRSMMFTREDGYEIDLHWHPIFEAHGSSSEGDFWNRAIPFELSGVKTLSLCPSDMLLQVIVHGLSWNLLPPIRWIADTIKLLENCRKDIDWPYFIDQTKKYRVALKVREAFYYLSATFNIIFPEETMNALNLIKIGYAELLVYKDAQKSEDIFNDRFFSKLKKLFLIYLRQTSNCGLLKQIFGFIKFLFYRTTGKNRFAILWYYLIKK